MASTSDDSAKTFLSNRAVARAWLDAGGLVFPCSPVTKTPLSKGWRRLDQKAARNAWAAVRQGLDAMPGLDCQALAMIVIDLDAKHNGIENFEALCREHGIDVGDCPTVKTPTGGVHHIFADSQARWRNSTSKLAAGVDTRGVGGYVVAAGALRSSFGVYEPVRPASLTEFIDRLASGRLAPPPKPLADLLDAHCLPGAHGSRTALRRPLTTVLATAPAVLSPANKTRTTTTPMMQSPLFDDEPCNWDELTAGVSERWTLEDALAAVAAAAPGTRNDTFARAAFTAGLRASALGLDPDQSIDTLIAVAKKAGSDDPKTVDTIDRCFRAGMARADEEVAAAAALSPVAAAWIHGARGYVPLELASYQSATLRKAKSRLHDAFLIERMLGRHRIRDDLVRKARAVADIRVRAKLMFTLAAFLLKSNHSPEEVVAAVSECGLPRSVGFNAVAWAQGTSGKDKAAWPTTRTVWTQIMRLRWPREGMLLVTGSLKRRPRTRAPRSFPA